MIQIPDAPWIASPDRYIDEYYGKPVYCEDEEEEEDDAD
jgi:hypothetical protein